MSSFIPMVINTLKSNFNVKNNTESNIKIKSELNPNASEFIPDNNNDKNKISFIQNNEICFDSLEKEFIKNNDWIFYI